jgi:hypothetical protein
MLFSKVARRKLVQFCKSQTWDVNFALESLKNPKKKEIVTISVSTVKISVTYKCVMRMKVKITCRRI